MHAPCGCVCGFNMTSFPVYWDVTGRPGMVRLWFGAQEDMPIPSELSSKVIRLKANNAKLTKLNLQGNRLTATEATELFQALALNTTLTKLSLFDNNISDAGATELSKALIVNNTLAKLDLASSR